VSVNLVGKKRILYVEDHRETFDLVAFILSDHKVVGAHSKAEGLRRVRGERFDLYIFDSNLPDGAGIELCLFIRTYDKKSPILLCTASPSITEQHAITAGAQRSIKKGAEFLDALEAAVSEFLTAAT
jgi:CheY-like chemotaxis protein